MIHDATDQAMQRALTKIKKLPVVKGRPMVLRVESFD